MMKKLSLLTLGVILLVTAIIPPVTQAGAPQAVNTTVAIKTPSILSIEWLSNEFQMPDLEIASALNKGYSLEEVYQAILEIQTSGANLDEALQRRNPSVQEHLDETLRFIQTEVKDPTVAGDVYGKDLTMAMPLDDMSVTEDVYAPAVVDDASAMTSLLSDTSPRPSTYDSTVVKRLEIRSDQAPYSLANGNESISTLSGDLNLSYTDLALPGRNGLSFALTRSYDSSRANLYDKNVEILPQWTLRYRPTYRVLVAYSAYNPDSLAPNGDFTMINEFRYRNSYGTNHVRQVGVKYYQHTHGFTDSSWNGISFYDAVVQGFEEEERRKLLEGDFRARNPQTDPPRFTYSFTANMGHNPNTNFYARLYPNGEITQVGGQFWRNAAVNVAYETAPSPLGQGWNWDIPAIETKNGNRYLRAPGGATYEVGSDLQLKGYPWKDITLTSNTSVTVNGKTSSHVLTSLSGVKHYFAADGKLIQKSDAYQNTIQFHYTHVSPYGLVLTKVRDALNNEINITYSPNQVIATSGDRTVTYLKQHVSGTTNKEFLVAVTDPMNRTTRYTHRLAAGTFNLLPHYSEPKSNAYALLETVEHPSGAKTEYRYTAYNRTIGKQNESETAFRVSSREDAIYYTTGSVDRSNRVTFAGVDTTYGRSATFQTTADNGRTKTTYTFEKHYIDEDTPSVYYNTNTVTEAHGTNPLEKQTVRQTFDTSRRLPVPNEVTSTFSKGTSVSAAVTTKATFDDYGNLLTETDPNQITTTYTYHAASHLLESISQPIGAGKASFTKLERYPQGSIKEVVVRDHRASGERKAQSNYEYDVHGNLTKVTIADDNRNIIVENRYADTYQKGYLTQQSVNFRDANGAAGTVVQQFEYNRLTGEMTRAIDGKGNPTQYQYDKLGRVRLVTYPDASTHSIAYDDVNNEVTVTDPTSVVTKTKWNPFGWKISTGIVGKAEQRFGYDSYGRLSWSDMGGRLRTAYQYDNWDRLIRTDYPGAGTPYATTTYDDVLRHVESRDEVGNRSKRLYDALGRVLRQEHWTAGNVLESSAEFTYDDVGNVLQSKDGEGFTTTYDYDVLGRLTSVLDPNQDRTSYAYSLAGDLTRITYADGNQVVKKYDELGRLIRQTDPSGMETTFFYDANGNVSQTVDRMGQAQLLNYNNRDFLISSSKGNETITYGYDAAGRRLWMQDHTGRTSYEYYPDSKWLHRVIYPDAKTLTYEYDLEGKRTKMTDPFGVVTVYGYDERNRLVGVGPAMNNWDASYGYRKNSQLESVTLRGATVSTYGYNGSRLESLVTARGSNRFNSFAYQYDRNLNQKQKVENGATYRFTYDKLNRIETSTQFNETYTYDKRGNRLTLVSEKPLEFAGTHFRYDERNRLTQVRTESGGNVSYRYNGDGMMVERSETGSTTRYYYDGANIIAEGTVASDGNVIHKASYIRGNQLVSRVDANGSKAYYVHNGHGDVVGLVDGAGNLVNEYSYDIWGSPIVERETVSNPFRYSGEYWDNATQLQYLRARWYDPSMGRFINEDTYEGDITNPLSLNLYTYVHNNPVLCFLLGKLKNRGNSNKSA